MKIDNLIRNKIKTHIRHHNEVIYDNLSSGLPYYDILIWNMQNEFHSIFIDMLKNANFKFEHWVNPKGNHYLIKIPFSTENRRAVYFSKIFGIVYDKFLINEYPHDLEHLEIEPIEEIQSKVERNRAIVNQFFLRFYEQSPAFGELSIQEFGQKMAKSKFGRQFNLRSNDFLYAKYYVDSFSLKDALKNLEENEQVKIKIGYLKSTLVRVRHFINACYKTLET